MKKLLVFLLTAVMLLSTASLYASAANLEFKSGITPDPESPLYEKRVLFVGDSITEAQCEWNKGKDIVGWPGRIIEGNNMTGVNKGRSGASVSNCRGSNTIIAQLQAERSREYDFVMIHGGVNDAWDAAPVGVMTEGFDDKYDLTTFGGGLEATFKFAKEYFENAYIGYIINFKINRGGIGKLTDMSEYFDLAKQICEKWGIPFIDLYTDEDFNNNQLKYKSSANLPDLIHPNSSGFDIIAPVINEFMETIPAFYEELNKPEEPSDAVSENVSDNANGAVSNDANENASDDENDQADNEDGGDLDLIIYIVCGVVAVAAIIAVVLVVKKR